MCGISGLFTDKPIDWTTTLTSIADRIIHRGPDGQGIWFNSVSRIGFAHCRLAILDLSVAGHQPMHSKSGRFTICFNGEIYNYREIRSELVSLGHHFNSDCDTEVILAAVEQWGVANAPQRLRGMFAFAIWDEQMAQLHLVRDRVGIKPLYYGSVGSSFVFASELHAFRSLGSAELEIDRNALAMYMRLGYIPTPYSVYQNIFKLPQGTLLTISREQLANWGRVAFSPFPDDQSTVTPQRFWDVGQIYHTGFENSFHGSFNDAVLESEQLLDQAIRYRMIADVPLGAFLSGGIDSSVIVTLMQRASPQAINTFSIGVEGHSYDESADAERLATHLGTNHTKIFVTAQDALNVVPHLSEIYDEPFADSSQIPTYLLSKITRQHVTVALSGDGGDEVFGGYNRYIHGPQQLARLRYLPVPIRRILATALSRGPWWLYGAMLKILAPVLPSAINNRWLEITIPKLANLLESKSQREFYDRVTLLWPTEILVNGGKQLPTLLRDLDQRAFLPGSHEMRCRDILSYHADDILTKVDRASMAVSLEVRVPFIDHHVIAFAAKLPENYLIENGKGKLVLREILTRHLPDTFSFGTNKRGFSIPLADWLRGPLKDWAAELLDPQKLAAQGFLNANLVHQTWQQHQSGQREWAYRLWNVLMFQAFLEKHHG